MHNLQTINLENPKNERKMPYVEPYTSYRSNTIHVNELYMVTLMAVWLTQKTIPVATLVKHKFIATLFEDNYTLKIQIFRNNTAGEPPHVIEFQRREGDGIACAKRRSDIVATISKLGFLIKPLHSNDKTPDTDASVQVKRSNVK